MTTTPNSADDTQLSDRAMSLMWLMEDEGALDCEDPMLEPYCDDEQDTDAINECFEAGLLAQWQQDEDLFCCRITDKGRSFIQQLSSRQPDLVEALTPSCDTKRAYWGEFHYHETEFDEDGNEVSVKRTVPWTTIKEIMAAILSRATDQTAPEQFAKNANCFKTAPDRDLLAHTDIVAHLADGIKQTIAALKNAEKEGKIFWTRYWAGFLTAQESLLSKLGSGDIIVTDHSIHAATIKQCAQVADQAIKDAALKYDLTPGDCAAKAFVAISALDQFASADDANAQAESTTP